MSPVPKWRNWQTRMVQVHVLARVWGFESLLRHQTVKPILRFDWSESGGNFRAASATHRLLICHPERPPICVCAQGPWLADFLEPEKSQNLAAGADQVVALDGQPSSA